MGTDISYIFTKQGVLYLSIIRDLYDNSIVSYNAGTEQTVNLVLNTVKAGMKKEKITGQLQLHSGGCIPNRVNANNTHKKVRYYT